MPKVKRVTKKARNNTLKTILKSTKTELDKELTKNVTIVNKLNSLTEIFDMYFYLLVIPQKRYLKPFRFSNSQLDNLISLYNSCNDSSKVHIENLDKKSYPTVDMFDNMKMKKEVDYIGVTPKTPTEKKKDFKKILTVINKLYQLSQKYKVKYSLLVIPKRSDYKPFYVCNANLFETFEHYEKNKSDALDFRSEYFTPPETDTFLNLPEFNNQAKEEKKCKK